MKVTCTNCHLAFDADDDSKVEACPRCNSRKLRKEFVRKEGTPQQGFKPRVYSSSGIVEGDTKQAWKSFHNQQSSGCSRCGGTEFEMNFKRKEKVCKKCGDVYPLPRRYA